MVVKTNEDHNTPRGEMERVVIEPLAYTSGGSTQSGPVLKLNGF